MGDNKPYAKNFLPIEGRSPLVSGKQQEMQRKLAQQEKHEHDLQAVETALAMGYSQRAVARQMGVSQTEIYRLHQEGRKLRLLENPQTLSERLDQSLNTQRHVLQKMSMIMNDPKALNKDKVAAGEVALKVQQSIDDIEGTRAPTKVTEAALAETVDAFVWVVGQLNPGQTDLYVQLLKQRLRGTQMGALLLGAGNNDALYVEAEEEDADDDSASVAHDTSEMLDWQEDDEEAADDTAEGE